MHVCSSVFLSIHPEHVSVTGCLSPGFACWKQRAVLDGSSLFSILLPLSLWGSGPLGKAPHSPAGLGSFSHLRGLEAVQLDSGLSVITSYTEAIAWVGVATGYSQARIYP